MSCSLKSHKALSNSISKYFKGLFSCILLAIVFVIVSSFQVPMEKKMGKRIESQFQKDSLAVRAAIQKAWSFQRTREFNNTLSHLQDALTLNQQTIKDHQMEGEIRSGMAWIYAIRYIPLFDRDRAEEEYQKAIGLFQEIGNTAWAIRVGQQLMTHYYMRKDSTILRVADLSRTILPLFDEFTNYQKEQWLGAKNQIITYAKGVTAYQDLPNEAISSIKELVADASDYYIKSSQLHEVAGLVDSAAVFRQKALTVYREILSQVDDPVIWARYLNAQRHHYRYLSIASLMPRHEMEYALSREHLLRTLEQIEIHLLPEQQFLKNDLICELAKHIFREAPNQGLEMLMSVSDSWTCLTNLSYMYQTLGNFEQAIAIDRRKYEKFENNGAYSKGSSYSIALNSQDLAHSLIGGRYYQEAEKYARISLKNLATTIEPTHARWAFAYHALAAALAGQNKFVEALEMIQKAEPIMIAIQGEIAGGDIKRIYTDHARILTELGRYQQATEYIDKAYQCLAYEPDLSWANDLRLLSINVLNKEKNYPAAIDSAQALRQFLHPSKVPIKQVIYPTQLLKVYTSIAEISYNQYRESDKLEFLVKSYANYKKATDLIDEIRQSYHWEDSKLFLLNEAQSIYNRTIETGLELAEIQNDDSYHDEAFILVERMKGILLLEALQSENAHNYKNIPADLLEKEEKLQLMLTHFQKSLFAETQKGNQADQENIDRFQNMVFKYHKSYDSLMIVIKNQHPSYYQLNYSIDFKSATEIQEDCKTNKYALINYLVADASIYAFVLTADLFEIIQIPVHNLTEKIQKLQKAIISPYLLDSLSTSRQQAYHDSLIHLAHDLYRELVAPIKEQIELPEKLIISPHGPLGYLPFEALLQAIPENSSNFNAYAYLLKEHQISYTYSATLLHEMKEKKYRTNRQDFIAFAPKFESTAVNSNRSLPQIRGALGELQYNIPEATGITNILGGVAITGIEATEERFVAEAPNYQIIHLSTHGKANDEQGDLAYLAFTELKDSLENEFLYNRDLYNMEIQADMVVLSACETGIGELQNGEGIISLARGFSYAGAKSIITTLWSVNDASTKEFMEQFYSYIKAGKPKDFALRQAKLDFLEKHVNEAHPFFWAPFVGIGDMAPIQMGGAKTSFIWVISILLLAVLGWLFLRKSSLRRS